MRKGQAVLSENYLCGLAMNLTMGRHCPERNLMMRKPLDRVRHALSFEIIGLMIVTPLGQLGVWQADV